MGTLTKKFISRGRRTASRVLEGSAIVLLLPQDGTEQIQVYELGPGATFLWKLIEEDQRIAGIVGRFAKRYAVTRREAARQVPILIANLRKDKLVEIKKRPSKAGKPWLK